jgi:hypothetical protein
MKICLNYYGQPRNLDITKYSFDNFIKNDNIEYHILYTTWDNEDITHFKQLFSTCFINQIEKPDLNDYTKIIDNYTVDPTNPHKTIQHYLLGLYIKKMSYTTIEKYNHDFDFIISLRTDIYLHDFHLSTYYNTILNNLNNTVFLPHEPKFPVYNENASPDTLYISNKSVMQQILCQIDILENCSVSNTNLFHPETSFYKSLVFYNLNIQLLNFRAFPQKLD